MEIRLRCQHHFNGWYAVEYGDGTEATVEQMSKDVTTFLMWTAEPHLESHVTKMGFKAIVYLIILNYFSLLSV